ncbi:MAG TPA: radical SAM protein [Candidatus Mailhella merdavium]|nr:radical SAM protein [Candidatus Mailhella merdavium]
MTSLYIGLAVYRDAPREARFLKLEAARLGKFFMSCSFRLPPYPLSMQEIREGRRLAVPQFSGFPKEINIVTGVSNCNIACRFCQQTFEDVPFRMMDPAIFRKAIDAVPQNIPIKVSMTPYTEPLLLHNLLPMIEYAVTQRPVAEIGFNTNGVLLNRRRIERIVDIQMKYIIISLNMPDRESYEWFTGKDFFVRVTENIKLLHTMKLERKSMYPKVIVQLLHHPKLENVLEESVRHWKQYANNVWMREISIPGNTVEARERLLESLGNNPFEEQIPALYPCVSPFISAAIDVNGYYVPCCSMGRVRSICQEGESPYDEMVLGHVSEMSAVEAWNSERMQKIRALQMTGLLDACRGCLSRQSREEIFFGLKEALMQSCYRI